jgi:hypothetical protein
MLKEIPTDGAAPVTAGVDCIAPVAMLMVSGYGGLGMHALLSIQRLFPGYYKNVVLLSVGVVDSGRFKGKTEVESPIASTESGLKRYVDFARGLGFVAAYR